MSLAQQEFSGCLDIPFPHLPKYFLERLWGSLSRLKVSLESPTQGEPQSDPPTLRGFSILCALSLVTVAAQGRQSVVYTGSETLSIRDKGEVQRREPHNAPLLFHSSDTLTPRC